MVHIPGVKNRAPDSVSRHPTGTLSPDKMLLTDDVHSITDSVTTPACHVPSQLMTGISPSDQKTSSLMENKMQDSLIYSLHTTTSITWEQVKTATASDTTMCLLLSTIEDGFPINHHPSSENSTNIG